MVAASASSKIETWDDAVNSPISYIVGKQFSEHLARGIALAAITHLTQIRKQRKCCSNIPGFIIANPQSNRVQRTINSRRYSCISIKHKQISRDLKDICSIREWVRVHLSPGLHLIETSSYIYRIALHCCCLLFGVVMHSQMLQKL